VVAVGCCEFCLPHPFVDVADACAALDLDHERRQPNIRPSVARLAEFALHAANVDAKLRA
jgi:hypothetical protein